MNKKLVEKGLLEALQNLPETNIKLVFDMEENRITHLKLDENKYWDMETGEIVKEECGEIVRNKKLPFNSWSQKRIDEGRKFCTSRTKKYVDDPRVDWIGLKLPLRLIKKYFWRLEGADSPEELQRVINQIFRKKVSEDRELYPHFGDFREGENKGLEAETWRLEE